MSRETWILVIFATLSSFGSSMLFPYIPIFGREIGMPIRLVGYLVFAYFAIEVLTRIPIGSITDALEHSYIITGGSAMFIGASLFYLFSSQAWQLLFIAQLCLGIGISVTWVTIPTTLTTTGGSLPIYTFSVGLGWLCGPPSGGLVKDLFGMYTLFNIFFFISLGLLVLAFLFFYERRKFAGSRGDKKEGVERRFSFTVPSFPELVSSSIGSFSNAFKIMKRKGTVLLAALVSFLMFMAFAMGSSLVPLYLSGIGLSSFMIGILLSIRTGTSTIIRLGTEKILKIGEKTSVLIIGTASTGLAILLLSQISWLPLLGILSIIWGLGGGLYLPVVFSLIADATTEKERGIAMGVRGTMGTSGSAIGVLVFTNLAEFTSVSTSLLIFGIFILTASATLLTIWKKSII